MTNQLTTLREQIIRLRNEAGYNTANLTNAAELRAWQWAYNRFVDLLTTFDLEHAPIPESTTLDRERLGNALHRAAVALGIVPVPYRLEDRAEAIAGKLENSERASDAARE